MNWKQFNFWNFWVPIIFFIVGILMGIMFPRNLKPTKKYPIKVQTYWTSGSIQSYPDMEADSVKGDTIWKNGNKIVNKNIINVTFK
jgi:hypothetical protein